jgi:hypothetical protein
VSTKASWRVVIKHNDTDSVLAAVDTTNLRDLDFSGRDLSGAAMYKLDFFENGSVVRAERPRVMLAYVSFASANLTGAVFSDETLVAVNFRNANLAGAFLARSHFVRTDFTGANMEGARMMETSFSNCPTLHLATGLDAVSHRGPSSLDTMTHRASVATLPDTFLLGIGYTKDEIAALRKIYRGNPAFYSCFISYARHDGTFAERLRNRLVKNDISCWQDTHDLVGGEYWRRQIDDAIDKHDKLILVCSQNSLSRPAVVGEIIEAIDRERASQTQKLFPIRLDDYVFSAELEAIAKTKVASGEWRQNWLTYVRAYHIPDFSRWGDVRPFNRETRKLIDALRHPPVR